MVVVRVAVVDYIGSTQLSVDNRAFSLHFVDQVFSTCQGKTTIIYLKMAPHGIWSISVQYNVRRMLELAVWKSGIYANVHWWWWAEGWLCTNTVALMLTFTLCSRCVKPGDYTTTPKSLAVSTLWFRSDSVHSFIFFLPDRFYRWKLYSGSSICLHFLVPPNAEGISN